LIFTTSSSVTQPIDGGAQEAFDAVASLAAGTLDEGRRPK